MLFIVAAAVLASAEPAAAAVAPAPAPVAKPKRICRMEEAVTGSLTPKRVCVTLPQTAPAPNPAQQAGQDRQPQAPSPANGSSN